MDVLSSMATELAYMLFGVGGVLGKAFMARLNESTVDYKIFGFDHARVDISNPSHVRPLVKYVRPNVVINCAALNDREICEEAKSGAYAVNARGPEIITEACAEIGAKLVHMSCCDVFDGKRMAPYSERCATRPASTHGKSRLKGEAAIRGYKNHLIIRPGWIFHHEENNCVINWIRRADNGQKITVMPDRHGSPTYVPDLVDATLRLVEMDAKGTFHVANAQAATMNSFASRMVALAKINPSCVELASPNMQGWFKAPFPRYTVLSSNKLRRVTGVKMRPWPDALKQCLFNINRYKP